MDAAIKTQWLEALRSGKYEQGRTYLRDPNNRFCCLGVLCDIVAPSEWRSEKRYDGGTHWSHQFGEASWLPTDVYTKSGMPGSGRSQETLAKMNDEGRTFAEIADHIERNL